jgi:AcrR family transcriptional regulator
MTDEIEQKEERISKVRDMKSELILNAALKVFSQKGIYETRLEDIAAEAGFSKASLYNYYPNKETIILSLTTREWENFIEQLNGSPEYEINDSQSFEENIRRYLLLSFKTFRKHFHFIATINILEFINTTNKSGDENLVQKFTSLRELRYKKGLLNIFSWARSKNEIKEEFPDVSLCRFVDAAIIGTIHDWMNDKKVGDIETTAQNLSRLLMNGMRK